tara:strand:+ start:449 stop:1075 length:627 start_codon:yes stop_codon:yes gene_type:complete
MSILEKALSVLNQYLSYSRYCHSIRVGETARCFADRFKLSLEDAYLAGILHDIAKPATPDNTYGQKIVFSEFENQLYEEFPRVWHAFVGPKYVNACCGSISLEIADAIMYHTTGTADMDPFTEILYVSDFVEPGRNTILSNYVNKCAQENFYHAIFAITVSNIDKLKKRKLKIHPETLNCFNFYKERVQESARKSIFLSLKISEDKFC